MKVLALEIGDIRRRNPVAASGAAFGVRDKYFPPAETDARGRYRLTGLGPGAWQVWARHDEVKAHGKAAPVELVPGRTVHQNLELPGRVQPPKPKENTKGPATGTTGAAAAEFERLWGQLGRDDTGQARGATWALSDSPDEAVAFLDLQERGSEE